MRLLRPSLLYGKHGLLGVGRTKFFEDYVHRNDGAVEQFIAGTSVRRLKLVKIGQRAVLKKSFTLTACRSGTMRLTAPQPPLWQARPARRRADQIF